MITFRIWLIEIPIAAVNAFVLMDRVYTPRIGSLRAHQSARAWHSWSSWGEAARH